MSQQDEDKIRARLLSKFMEGISVLDLGKIPDEYAHRVDAVIDEAIAAVQAARIEENNQTMYLIDDTELDAETIVKALKKDRTARISELQKENK